MTEGTNIGGPDGREGNETISGMKVDPRYIYYRLYTQEGALESNNPIYTDERFIGRILSKSVTPPHTAAFLKNRIRRIEGFEAPKKCDLYLSLSEKTPVEDSTRMQLRGEAPGPGPSEIEPIALVFDISDKKRTFPSDTISSKDLPKWQGEKRYVYYRLFNEDGELQSITSFDETDVTLGRVDVLSLLPPHSSCTGASLKSRLAKVECAQQRDLKLFKDESGDATIEDNDIIDLFSSACPGIIQDASMAFVHSTLRKKISATRAQDPVASFSNYLKATSMCDWGKYDSAWHTTTIGEVFYSDRIPRTEPFKKDGYTEIHNCYEATNCSGKRAFVLKQHSTFPWLHDPPK